MESASPMKLYFSDRFGTTPRQPFNANDTAPLIVSVSVGLGDHKTISVSISVFSKTVKFTMDRLGDLYVGVGPSLGKSSGAVFVLAFIGIIKAPH